MYRKRDIEVLFDIKQLLYDQRFTIAGARRKILDDRQDGKDQIEMSFSKLDKEETIRALKKDMETLLAMLKQDFAKRARGR
jgi:DNA-binding transcriptional MerR regulator